MALALARPLPTRRRRQGVISPSAPRPIPRGSPRRVQGRLVRMPRAMLTPRRRFASILCIKPPTALGPPRVLVTQIDAILETPIRARFHLNAYGPQRARVPPPHTPPHREEILRTDQDRHYNS